MYEQNPLLYTKIVEKIEGKKNQYHSFENAYYLQNTRTITTKQDRHPNAGIIDLKQTLLENQKDKANYRFLTPRETYLMMGFDEVDYENVIKNQNIKKEILYRQAGNSIVVNVLVAIFYLMSEIGDF